MKKKPEPPKLPTNDAEYIALLKRILEGAYYIEDNELTPDAHAKAMKLYDEMCELARAYRTKPEERRRRERERNSPNSATA